MIYLAASVARSDSSQMAKRKEKKIEKEEEERQTQRRNTELEAAYVNRQVKTMSAAQSDISKAHL